jgi:hypothetical protein
VDREQRVRKFTLDNESPIQGQEPQSSFPRPRNLSEIRRRDASPPVNTKSTNAKKKPHARQARGKVWEGRSVHDRYHFVALEKIV